MAPSRDNAAPLLLPQQHISDTASNGRPASLPMYVFRQRTEHCARFSLEEKGQFDIDSI
jgi:hypothetical protein